MDELYDVFRGTNSGSVTRPVTDLPFLIKSFRIINKVAGAVTFNVYIGTICIAPYNSSLDESEMYQSTEPILLRGSEELQVTSTGQVDYDFTLQNVVP